MYICSNCQKTYNKWQGQCSNCLQWGTLVEDERPVGRQMQSRSKGSLSSSKKSKSNTTVIKPVKLHELEDPKGKAGQITTGISEFDHTLGGRLIPGQVVLLAGAPGVGKSTLSLEIIERLSEQGLRIMYIAGEESPSQIKQRAIRLKLNLQNVNFISEININEVERFIASNVKNIDLIVADSIQTLYSPDLTSTTGSISQINESTNRLVNLAKGFDITTIIIGHVTKTGDIAGPKILEHMVDTVLYFEGERKFDLRVLRVEKNRFGPTDEVGIFRMEQNGLKEVRDTKELFDPKKEPEVGSVYSMAMEGNRPVVVEVQALATKSYFPNPRRTASGFDMSRLFIILAIIDKRLKLKSYEYDVYVNITGGIKFNDPALDLAVLRAITSSIKNVTVPRDTLFFGEVGLTGEIRKVFNEEKRIKEAKRLGFEKVMSNKLVKRVEEL